MVLVLHKAKHPPIVHVLKAGQVPFEQSEKGSTCWDESTDTEAALINVKMHAFYRQR